MITEATSYFPSFGVLVAWVLTSFCLKLLPVLWSNIYYLEIVTKTVICTQFRCKVSKIGLFKCGLEKLLQCWANWTGISSYSHHSAEARPKIIRSSKNCRLSELGSDDQLHWSYLFSRSHSVLIEFELSFLAVTKSCFSGFFTFSRTKVSVLLIFST